VSDLMGRRTKTLSITNVFTRVLTR
jgi:hypothetical protein